MCRVRCRWRHREVANSSPYRNAARTAGEPDLASSTACVCVSAAATSQVPCSGRCGRASSTTASASARCPLRSSATARNGMPNSQMSIRSQARMRSAYRLICAAAPSGSSPSARAQPVYSPPTSRQ